MELGNQKKDNYATKKRLPENVVIRHYHKQYGSLHFAIIRSPQQIVRWNHLTCSVMRSKEHSPFIQPKIIHPSTVHEPDPVVFKQLRHLPTKLIPLRHGHYIKASSVKEKRFRKWEKNWLHQLHTCNKKKKKLPPLPPGHVEDPHHQKRFDVSSIPHYNYGYLQALAVHQTYKRKPPLMINTIPKDTNADVIFVMSDKDRNIINDPSIFLRCTPPPDNDSTTTISDNSYMTATDSYLRVALSDERKIQIIEYV
ncbi:hypothetical protein RhiirB3_432550 [Rhizophagus irregularis]|nr:hypothetical protein RhiirB3_432550 [Rhizophagus irregularis]